MKHTHLAWIGFSIVLAGLIAACDNSSGEKKARSAAGNTETILSRGEYLVNSIGCEDCHSPKKMGPNGPEIITELRFSGYPSDRPVNKADTNVVKQGWALFGPDLTNAVGPWGMSFAANISSDSTGIGAWNESQFLTAIRHGKSKGIEANRPLLPPMPWFVYKNMTDDDLKAIFAYLKSTPPVRNVVPAPVNFNNL